MRVGQGLLAISLLWSSAANPAVTVGSNYKLDPATTKQIQVEGKTYLLVGGDMLFPPGENTGYAAGKTFWKNGILFYAFDPGVTPDQQSKFIAACNAWGIGTPIQCRLRATEPDYVYVKTHNGDACAGKFSSCSVVGEQGGLQYLQVYTTHYDDPYVLEHEIGHALGFIHEHQRIDRDSYILVHEDRMQPGLGSQVLQWAQSLSQYDYNSIMHYHNCTFSKNPSSCVTDSNQWVLEPVSCGLTYVGGDTISALDYDGARLAYAPYLVQFWGKRSAATCGSLTYQNSLVQAGCNGACQAVQAIDKFTRLQTRTNKSCGGFLPLGWGHELCPQIQRDEVSISYDDDAFSCGRIHTDTRHEVTAVCGCHIATFQATCSMGTRPIDSFDFSALDPALATSIQSFVKLVHSYAEKGLVQRPSEDAIDTILFENAGDPLLAKKLNDLHKFGSGKLWALHLFCPNTPTRQKEFDDILRSGGLRVSRANYPDEKDQCWSFFSSVGATLGSFTQKVQRVI